MMTGDCLARGGGTLNERRDACHLLVNATPQPASASGRAALSAQP